MERDVQTEREMPRDISYYRERATQYNQVLFETSVVLNGGVPSKDVWSVADLPRMVERVVQRAEAAESRIRELEIANASLIGAIDSAIIETRRLRVANGELEASCATMREVLELSDYKGERLSIVAGEDRPVRLLCEQYGYGAVMDSAARQWRNALGSYGDGALMVGHSAAVVQAALSTTAGTTLLERLEKLERVAEAARQAKRRFEREDTRIGFGRPEVAWAMHDDLKTALATLGGYGNE